MNPANQGHIPDVSAIPGKRKRGRPRKDRSFNGLGTAPSGFKGLRRNQPFEAQSVDDMNDPIVGQAVAGIVEAAFDAGYLLTVRIGNSNTNLRGVVFKPGHFIPVTAQNDIAPNVKMIRRNEIYLHKENKERFHGMKQVHRPASQTPSKGKEASHEAAPSVYPESARSNIVSVVSQPINPSNELFLAGEVPLAASPVMPVTVTEYKDLQTVTPLAAALPLDEFTSTNQVQQPSQPQNTLPVTQKGVQDEVEQTKSTMLPDITPSKLVKDVIEVLETQADNGNEAACKSSAVDCGVALERETMDISVPICVKPPEATLSNLHNQSATLPRMLENKSNGRMTELLQALQENMTDYRVHHQEEY